MEKPFLSLIIPAYNEEKFIGATLGSILKAKASFSSPSSIEVIVVDNCSTDNTSSIARTFGAKVVTENERRIASVRNKGAKVAQGAIVGFLDADSRITPNMFNSINAAMSSGQYVGGGTLVKFNRNSLGLFLTYCITVIPARWLLGVMGGLIFSEKQAFEKIGGFNESLYCAEDSKFILDLKKYSRQVRKRFKIITTDYVTTSTRTFDKLGDWYYFKNIPKILLKGGLKAFRNKEIIKKFWYDVDR